MKINVYSHKKVFASFIFEHKITGLDKNKEYSYDKIKNVSHKIKTYLGNDFYSLFGLHAFLEKIENANFTRNFTFILED